MRGPSEWWIKQNWQMFTLGNQILNTRRVTTNPIGKNGRGGGNVYPKTRNDYRLAQELLFLAGCNLTI